MDKQKLAQKVRDLRKAAGLTQDAFCAQAGFSMKVIRDIEAGSGNPTLETLDTIAKTLQTDVISLLGGNATAPAPAPIRTAAQMTPEEFAKAVAKVQQSQNGDLPHNDRQLLLLAKSLPEPVLHALANINWGDPGVLKRTLAGLGIAPSSALGKASRR